MSVATTLKTLRKTAGMTQREFGALIGYSLDDRSLKSNTFRKFETGSQRLSLEQAWTIAEIFKLTLPQIMGVEPLDLTSIASIAVKLKCARLEAELKALQTRIAI